MASAVALSPIRRRMRSEGRRDQSLFLIAALFMAVFIVEAVVVMIAAPHIPDITSLYVTTT